ncbi:MAG: hypothetical protein QOF85_496 [Solirubrobacterales bacterium]|jgi:hypothetical protein|nr:hypothetical protein [Solirubrobacterales bacterium]
MTKPRPQQPSPTTKPAYDTTRLVVWGERRKEPDWDTFVAALLAYAIAQVEGDKSEDES